MKKWKILLLLSLASTLFAQNTPVAVVRLFSTKSISVGELKEKIANAELLLGQPLDDRAKSLLLDQMVASILILQQAEKDSITIDDKEVLAGSLALLSRQQGRQVTEAELRLQLRQSGTNFDDFIKEAKEQLLLQKYILGKYSKELREVTEPTQSEIEKFYDTYPREFVVGDRLAFKQIFIQTLGLSDELRTQAYQRAQDLYKRVENGEDLGELSSLYSEEAVSRQNEGNVGFVQRSDPKQIERFGQAFFDQIFTMKEGAIALLTSDVGYHIVQIGEFRKKELLGLDDQPEPDRAITVKEIIRLRLKQNKQQEQLLELQKKEITTLREQASINLLEQNLPFKYEPST